MVLIQAQSRGALWVWDTLSRWVKGKNCERPQSLSRLNNDSRGHSPDVIWNFFVLYSTHYDTCPRAHRPRLYPTNVFDTICFLHRSKKESFWTCCVSQHVKPVRGHSSSCVIWGGRLWRVTRLTWCRVVAMSRAMMMPCRCISLYDSTLRKWGVDDETQCHSFYTVLLLVGACQAFSRLSPPTRHCNYNTIGCIQFQK